MGIFSKKQTDPKKTKKAKKAKAQKKSPAPQGAERRLLLIINPVSGKLKARAAVLDIIEKLTDAGYIPTVMPTKYRGHARELAASADAAGFSRVVCCGGDGTLNEVISGLLSGGTSSPIPIGYIPAGSTNDFASGIGIPSDLAMAAEAAAGGGTTALDIGRFGEDRYFTYIASFGAFTAASYSAPQNVKNNLGHFAYVIEGLKEFFKIKPIKVVCEDGDKIYRGDYVFCGVANSLSVGGLVKLDPSMVGLDDGVFEVILVKRPKNVDEFNCIVQALLTSELDCPMIDFFRTSHVRFRVPAGTVWTLDGERAECGGKVELSVLPRAVRLVREDNK